MMKRVGSWGLAVCFVLVLFSVDGLGQILLNELDINPGGTDNGCEYVELIGQPGAVVENIHFVSVEGDSNKGLATAVITFGSPGPVLGSNGLLVVVSAAGCPPRTYPAGTTVITTDFLNTGVLQNGSNSFLLISSTTAIAPNTDLDTNDDGTLDNLPAGATILDGVAWLEGDSASDVVYGTVLTATGNVIGAATRFVGNTRANYAGAWYAGVRVGQPADTTYSTTARTLNFPPNGALTPGAPNVGNAPPDSPVDINGDGRTDFVVVRPAGGEGSQLAWHTHFTGGAPHLAPNWGVVGDQVIAGDYDGDGLDDPAVFRPSEGRFYIIHTATQTIRADSFGQSGDNARVVGDYDGDGRDDLAVYRPGAHSLWYFRTSPASPFHMVEWGMTGDVPAPGDYDGDGKADFVVRRTEGPNGVFWKWLSGGSFANETFGLAADTIVPGDYDGDGKTDLAVFRTSGGFYVWDFEPSGTAGSTVVSDTWGMPGDVVVPGDYTGDGKSDYAIWRAGSPATFHVMTVGTRMIFSAQWGQTGDVPVAQYGSF